MTRLFILVAQIIILMTRMLPQICKQNMERLENKAQPAAVPLQGVAAPRRLLSELSVVLLWIGTIIRVIRMII